MKGATAKKTNKHTQQLIFSNSLHSEGNDPMSGHMQLYLTCRLKEQVQLVLHLGNMTKETQKEEENKCTRHKLLQQASTILVLPI